MCFGIIVNYNYSVLWWVGYTYMDINTDCVQVQYYGILYTMDICGESNSENCERLTIIVPRKYVEHVYLIGNSNLNSNKNNLIRKIIIIFLGSPTNVHAIRYM